MKTQQEALTWLNAQIGQRLDYDHVYGDQCVDFFNFYYQFVTGDGPFLDGYQVTGAKSLFGVTNSRLDRIVDSNTLVPQPGDVAVYGATWGNGNGHVEVCISSDAHGSFFIGENEHGNPSEGVVKVYRTWAQMRGLEGVLRFHFAQPAPAPAPVQPVPQPAPAAPAPAPAPVDNPAVVIGDRVLTSSEVDQNGTHLNLGIINDGQSVFSEVNSRGEAVLRMNGVVRCAVPVSSLRKA